MARRTAPQPGHPAVMATLIIMFIVGALVVPAVSNYLGTMTYDLETGRGRVTVSSCRSTWPWHDCTATLTTWSGEKHHVGEQVLVRSKSALSGEVDVVGRVRGVSTIDEYRRTNFSTEDVMMTADVWVMPAWARIPFIIALAIAWLALMWGARQWARRLTEGRGSSAEGRGR